MKKLFLFAFITISIWSFSQKMKLTSGSLDFLKGQKQINVEFDYSNVTFYKEEMSQENYIQKRIDEIGNEKGDEEARKWKEDYDYTKTVTIPEKFLASLNKNSSLKGEPNSNTPFTIVVQTVWVYPGWFGGVMSQPAKVSTNLKFVETKNHNNVLAIIESKNAPGDGNFVGVPNNNDRIAEGYAKTAKSLAKFINKYLD